MSLLDSNYMNKAAEQMIPDVLRYNPPKNADVIQGTEKVRVLPMSQTNYGSAKGNAGVTPARVCRFRLSETDRFIDPRSIKLEANIKTYAVVGPDPDNDTPNFTPPDAFCNGLIESVKLYCNGSECEYLNSYNTLYYLLLASTQPKEYYNHQGQWEGCWLHRDQPALGNTSYAYINTNDFNKAGGGAPANTAELLTVLNAQIKTHPSIKSYNNSTWATNALKNGDKFQWQLILGLFQQEKFLVPGLTWDLEITFSDFDQAFRVTNPGAGRAYQYENMVLKYNAMQLHPSYVSAMRTQMSNGGIPLSFSSYSLVQNVVGTNKDFNLLISRGVSRLQSIWTVFQPSSPGAAEVNKPGYFLAPGGSDINRLRYMINGHQFPSGYEIRSMVDAFNEFQESMSQYEVRDAGGLVSWSLYNNKTYQAQQTIDGVANEDVFAVPSPLFILGMNFMKTNESVSSSLNTSELGGQMMIEAQMSADWSQACTAKSFLHFEKALNITDQGVILLE